LAQVSITKGIIQWTFELAKKHIVNETSFQLHNIIIIEHNEGNPFETWKQVFSYYTWLEGNDKSQHCVRMAIILVNKGELFLQKPNRFGWFLVGKDVERTLAIGARLGSKRKYTS
jgi:hypothetical protein